MGLSESKVHSHEDRAAIVDVDLDQLEEFRDCMKRREAKYNSDGSARQQLRSKLATHLLDDAPGSVLDHQINAICLLMGLMADFSRGGVYADEAGLGKTLVCLLLGRLLCPPDRVMVILSPKILVESVWQLELKKWLKDQRHVVVNNANEVPELIRRKSELGGHFIFVNADDMVQSECMWTKFAKLDPFFLFIDEGHSLGRADNKIVSLVEAIKARDTIPWVVTAAPFKDGNSGRTEDMERKFVQSMVQYDAITRRREVGKTLAKRIIAAIARMGRSAEVALTEMHFIIRHTREEVQRLLPRLSRVTKQAHPPTQNTHKRFAAALAVFHRQALFDDKVRCQHAMKQVLEMTSLEPLRLQLDANQVILEEIRKTTSKEYADIFECQVTYGLAEMSTCECCSHLNALPLCMPCCKRASPKCTTCMMDSFYDGNGKPVTSLECPSCTETFLFTELQRINHAGSLVKVAVTPETCCEKTGRGAALLRALLDGQKVLIAGVRAEERSHISAMLQRKNILHCCPGDAHNDPTTLAGLEKFAWDPDMRVLIMPQNLRQGVDLLKVAKRVVFWDMEHLDYRNLVNRHSIIKRICRLGCEHKVVEVVTLQQSFLELSDDGADRPALRTVRLCPVEEVSDNFDMPSSSTRKLKRPAEIPTESLHCLEQLLKEVGEEVHLGDLEKERIDREALRCLSENGAGLDMLIEKLGVPCGIAAEMLKRA